MLILIIDNYGEHDGIEKTSDLIMKKRWGDENMDEGAYFFFIYKLTHCTQIKKIIV